jgi:hypothetical protein
MAFMSFLQDCFDSAIFNLGHYNLSYKLGKPNAWELSGDRAKAPFSWHLSAYEPLDWKTLERP